MKQLPWLDSNLHTSTSTMTRRIKSSALMMQVPHHLVRRVVLLVFGHVSPNLRIAQRDNVLSRSSRLVALSLDVVILPTQIDRRPLRPRKLLQLQLHPLNVVDAGPDT